jgi:hypothetical protein
MIVLATASLTVAWAGLLIRDITSARWMQGLPSWPIALLLAVGAVCALSGRDWRRGPVGLWAAIALTMVAFFLFTFPPANSLSARRAWWRESVRRIANTLEAVGDEVADLENVSGSLATRVRSALAGRNPATLRSDPTEAFALLDSLAQSVSRGHALTPGTAIGLQLFAPDGARVAWAGWPQATTTADIAFVTSGTEFLYTRTVSLYQILSHVVPCRNATGELVATLLVDMPLEVDYRVNNRFLKSASLADNIPKIATARVSFEYFPPAGNLPQRLEQLKEQAAAAREQRVNAIEAAKARSHQQSPRAAGADTLLQSGFTWEDSVLTYGAFPANVEPEGDVAGDEHLGLAGRALIRSRFGNPLLYTNATGEPLEHFLSMRVSTRSAWGTVAALLALVTLFVQVIRWIPLRGRALLDLPRVARALIFVVFMVALRYALLALGISSSRVNSRLFDPPCLQLPRWAG